MEPKRELTSVDLAALVREFGPYEGAIVDKAYLYGDDLVRLRMRDPGRGRVEVLIEIGEAKRAHVADPDHVPEAPDRPPDFARKLRGRLSGATFEGVTQYGFDRILRFEFDRPDGSTTVVAELFGDGNVVVLDATGRVVACLETVRLKSRTVVPGSQYEYPAARVNPLALDATGFRARMADSDTDLVRTLATQLEFGGLYAEELCTRAGVEKTKAIADAGTADYDALYEAVGRLADDLEAGAFDPRIYREDDRPVDVTPFPLREHDEAGLAAEAVDAFMPAVDAYYAALEATTGAEPAGPDFEAEVAKYERILAQQRGAIEAFEAEAAETRKKAEAIYADYDLVDEVLSTVRAAQEDGVPWEEIDDRLAVGVERGIPAAEAVEAIDPASGTVTVGLGDLSIELDPRSGVEKNADRLYTEAKAIEGKRAGAEEAIADTEAELAAVEERRRAWEAGGSEAEGDAEGAERGTVDWLAESSIPVRLTEHWYERFRWFHTSDGFLVIGGRDADQNEELVRKYLEPGDRFLHAQAHGGPATILKATGPSERAREVDIPERSFREAACFAVSYASVWRDGVFAGDVYLVDHDQVSKTPESGEYLEKGAFAIRGERTYFRDVPVGCAVGIRCEPETRVIGGPPDPIRAQAATAVAVEPGRYAQGDVAKRIYRTFRDRFADTGFVRSVASPDEIARFLPPGGSRLVDE